jgi:hypothetical protein
MGGLKIQRDQAIGRIGIPWRHIKEGIGNAIRQAIQCMARNSDEAVVLTGSESAKVEMESLRGDFIAVVDVDENIPATWTEKSEKIEKILDGVATNPFYGKLLEDPDNLELVYQAGGLKGLVIMELVMRDKQLGEIEMMLGSGPITNPAIGPLTDQINELKAALEPIQAEAVKAAENGQQPDAAHVQKGTELNTQLTALEAQLQALPPKVSSVAIDDRVERQYHAVSAMTCLKYLMGTKGRALLNGDEKDQESYENIRLHFIEHDDAALKQAANQPPTNAKPPSVSISSKDLPPKELAAATQKAGIPADPKDFDAQETAEALAKHPGPGGIQVQSAPAGR